MTKRKIFISSVQKEFKDERRGLKDYISGDPLLGRFFDVFLFEALPASDRRADEVYLKEVGASDIYLGLFGDDYGKKNREGRSPTHEEFLLASKLGKFRLIFVKGESDANRHPQMLDLLKTAGDQLIRRRFNTLPELNAAVYASLVSHLLETGRIMTGPFDATACRGSAKSDVSEEKIRWFLSRAKNARDYALDERTPVMDVLAHLDLLDKGKPNHAGILLFGKKPQRFLISSEVKCMHFHGLRKLKPIASYQIYRGTVFEMVDQAVDFVMSKLNRSVGTRVKGPQVPVEYDIPQEVVAEGIVNAVAHRDYTSNASVEIMLFADRLEIWNPGTLPPLLTIAGLSKPHSSQPGNPLIAEPLFLTKYIEKAGTGTVDIFDNCRKAGLKMPEFRLENGFFILTVWRKKASGRAESQPESRLESQPELLDDRVLLLLKSKILSKSEISLGLGQKGISGQLNKVMRGLLDEKYVEYTSPEKPNSRLQEYRLTKKGMGRLKKLKRGG
jgi:ATP-dependent DNA helicase RecG